MYSGLLVAHGLFRWVVIFAGVAAVGSAIWSLLRQELYEQRHAALGRLFVITVDVQVAMGATLYALFSPLTTLALDQGIAAPPGSEVHFFSSTHWQVMSVVLVCAHVSTALIRRAHGSEARLRRCAVCYGATLAVLIAGVPWWRPLLRF
jgi:hypothetical protein